VVLAGRAPEEALVPYQPFIEALRHYFSAAQLDELRASVREYGPELAQLVPELRRRVPDLPQPPAADPESERYRLFEAAVGLLTAISARAPILLVLDDLHWAGRPTLMLLRHLARAPEPARLLILVAYRTEPTGVAIVDALADLRREGLVSQLDIGGLSERETAELVQIRTAEAPSRAFARALHAETEGNPFFIEEIVRYLVEAGVRAGAAGASELQRFGLPEGVSQMIARRLDRLDPKTIEWLRVASVIGRDFDIALLERLVALEEEVFLNSLEQALSAGLLLESPDETGQYSFSHTLIREALYEGMSSARRARIHRRVGEALEAPRRASVTILAHHFTRGASPEDADKAITYASQAGEKAAALLAHDEAAEHYSRALEVLTRYEPDALERRCSLALLVGEERMRGGERELARNAFREAAALAEQLGDSAGLARAAIGASQRYVQQPGVVDEELIGMLERALETNSGRVSSDRVRLLNRLCGALYYSAERTRMAELSAEATSIATKLGDPEAEADARGAVRRALWDPDHLKERLAASTEMLRFARRIGNLELQLHAHAWLVLDLFESGDRDAVEAQIAAFTTGAEQLRQPLYIWQAVVWQAMKSLLEGRLGRAEELAAEALAAGAPAESLTATQYYAIQMLAIRREQARMGELEDAARQMVAANPARPAWRVALGVTLAESGNPAGAGDELDELAREQFLDIPRDGDWLTTMTLTADLCAALRDRERSALVYELLVPFAGANAVAGIGVACLGSVARQLGKLAAVIGRERDAAANFQRAMEVHTRLTAPVLLAHTQLDYAEALGRGPRAARMIDEAADTAAQLVLPAVAGRVERLRAI
jgi:hypothetical protein